MVAETGDATARFLRSVAAGDVDPRPDEEAAAAAGAQRMAVLSPPKKQACCQASADLVRRPSAWGNLIRSCAVTDCILGVNLL